MLAFAVAVGLLSVAILQPLWEREEEFESMTEEDTEFFVDDEDF
jgi:hypothetical protein